ncbi:hypothetical protein B0A52_00054 [Exophiala mesophila]|uniref:Uncharacterized protein n=1 Tax=Exophiala mesophila TaxID=212818 RepID=A0A438NIZ0_EXOME|nr:hypothetical protein B0A52_00054 [Exophiala mesophila]
MSQLHEDHAPVALQSPTRPGSSWTSNSGFADSAISLRSNTPRPMDDSTKTFDVVEEPTHVTNRLNGLVSEIWATEQDGSLHPTKRRRIEKAIDLIEAALNDDDPEHLDDAHLQSQSSNPSALSSSSALPSELAVVRENLANTIDSMRMRQHEQRHLQQLTVEKLEAVAEQCLRQEKRLHEFSDEIVRLKRVNGALVEENNMLSTQVDLTTLESVKRDTAVNAMSSAVAGLEGWINNTPTPSHKQRKIVTRGKGRFRGRYYVDDPEQFNSEHNIADSPDAKIREGVNSWLRGFRDIEDELRSSASAIGAAPRHAHKDDEDDWGDFESAAA